MDEDAVVRASCCLALVHARSELGEAVEDPALRVDHRVSNQPWGESGVEQERSAVHIAQAALEDTRREPGVETLEGEEEAVQESSPWLWRKSGRSLQYPPWLWYC